MPVELPCLCAYISQSITHIQSGSERRVLEARGSYSDEVDEEQESERSIIKARSDHTGMEIKKYRQCGCEAICFDSEPH